MKLGDPITIADMSKRRAEVEWLGMAVLLANDKGGDIWQVVEAKTLGGKLRLTIQCDHEVMEVARQDLIRLTMKEVATKFYRLDPRWDAVRAVLRAPFLAQLKLRERVKGTINATQDPRGRRWKGKRSVNDTCQKER